MVWLSLTSKMARGNVLRASRPIRHWIASELKKCELKSFQKGYFS